MLGTTVSHYRVLQAIGKGGMGVVYRAEDERLGRQVALKFLPEELSDDRQALERFKREARAASVLNHPNICVIYDVGESDGRSFIAMEFLEGDTLQQRIAGRPLANEEILELGLQLVGALDAAHSKGIVHRDIKPANIIVDAHGNAKLLDFGLASIDQFHGGVRGGPVSGMTETVMPQEGLTTPGTALGTAAYMAPEQARGEELDARTDLFSFGAVLYEMCTGKPAFGGATLAMIFDGILHKEPVAPQQLNPSLLAGLDAVVKKALAKDREERYQSAAEIRADLKRLRRESESGKSAAAVEPTIRSRRRTWIYAGVGLTVAAVAVVVGVSLYRSRQSAAPMANAAEWIAVTNFADSAVSPALSPDGRVLTFIRGGDTFFGPGDIYAKLMPDGDPVQITHDKLDKMAPALSPDGSKIAYTTAPGWATSVVPVLGGEPRQMFANAAGLTWIDQKQVLFSEIKAGLHMSLVTAGENREGSRDIYVPSRDRGMVHRSAISPNHKWALAVHMDNGGWLPCLLVPFEGGAPARIVGPKAGGCTYVAWSPDGAWMYFSSDAGGRFHIWRQHFPDGEPQQVTSGGTEEEGIAMAPDGRSLITSVGLVQTTVVVRDEKGEREVSSESYTETPRFSDDGKFIFYLVSAKGATGHSFVEGELFRADLETGRSEHLMPGFSMGGYDLSFDGKRVVFSALDKQGRVGLWTADLDMRSAPREFPAPVDEDQPNLDRDGNIYFRAAEGGSNFLYRMNPDGGDRRKVWPDPILESYGVSPDGRWSVVWSAANGDSETPYSTIAVPLAGGAPVTICSNLCRAIWGNRGKVFVILSEINGAQTLLAPVTESGLPEMPAGGITVGDHHDSLKGQRVVPDVVIPGPNPGQYVLIKQSVHRNLYRIPLP